MEGSKANAPCYVCGGGLPKGWAYLCCHRCGEHCDYDFDTDKEALRDWRERHADTENGLHRLPENGRHS